MIGWDKSWGAYRGISITSLVFGQCQRHFCMPKTRTKKNEEVQTLVQNLQRMKSVIFSGYAGLSVPEVTELRKKLREQGVEYRVVKKTLLRRAFAEAGLQPLDLDYPGGLALAFSFEDEVLAAKLLANFRKEHEAIVFHGGLIDGQPYSQNQIETLAQLPSREQLLTNMVGSLASPLRGILTVLVGPTRNLLTLFQALSQQSKS